MWLLGEVSIITEKILQMLILAVTGKMEIIMHYFLKGKNFIESSGKGRTCVVCNLVVLPGEEKKTPASYTRLLSS